MLLLDRAESRPANEIVERVLVALMLPSLCVQVRAE